MTDEAQTTSEVATARDAARPQPPAPLARNGGQGVTAGIDVAAKTLISHGFDVRGPDWEEGRSLTVTGLRDTMCEVTVEDSGFVIWEYRPGDSADPDKVAARVMRLLADGSPAVPAKRLDRPEPRTALKGLVGRRLEARGMVVCLEVFEDQVAYEVAAEVAVTNPDCPERGRVHVTDDGALMWECGFEEHDSDTGAIAGLIAAILAEDIAQGCVQRGRRRRRTAGRGIR
jgi:hypothetical protein